MPSTARPAPSDPVLACLEADLYKSRHDDGLIDLVLGVGVALLGLDLMLGEAYTTSVYAALVIMTWPRLRRSIVEPRAGVVEFTDARRAREALTRRRLLIALALGVLAGIGTFALAGGADPGRIPFGVGLAVLVAASGRALELRRFYLHATWILTAFFAARVFGGRGVLPACLMAAGGVITLTGAGLFVRFLRQHPRIDD